MADVCPEVALVLKKKWATMVIDGSKTMELRSHATTKRGLIAIAASKTKTLLGQVEVIDSILLAKRNEKTGLLEDCSPAGLSKTRAFHQVEDIDMLSSYREVHGWCFRNPVRYDPPKQYTHTPGAIQWVKLKQSAAGKRRTMKKPARKTVAKTK